MLFINFNHLKNSFLWVLLRIFTLTLNYVSNFTFDKKVFDLEIFAQNIFEFLNSLRSNVFNALIFGTIDKTVIIF